MKFEINKEVFQKAVGVANKVISLRPTTPVLSNLLLKTRQGGLEIVSTNLDATIKVWLGAKVIEEGETTAPARLLNEFLSTLSADKVVVSQDKETLLMSSGEASAKIPTIFAKEFPTLPHATKAGKTQIDKKTFVDSVKLVSGAASQDEGRPVLTGVLFRPNKKTTTMVATDGYRLAKKEIGGLETKEVIIPARDLIEAVKTFADSEDEKVGVNISEEENQATFIVSHMEYSTKLIAGEFPNYEQIIPDAFVTHAVFNREALLESLKIVSTFAKDLGNVVRMVLKENNSYLSASSPQIGESKVGVAPKIDGQSLEVAFNSRYLLDGISSVEGEEVEIHFAGAVNPALLKSPEDDSFVYVVMPVRTQT